MGFKIWPVASILGLVHDGRDRPGNRLEEGRRPFERKPVVSGDVHRYGFPRTDLTVTLDGVLSSRLWHSEDGLRSSQCTESHGHGRSRAA